MKQLKTEIIALCDYANVSREGKLSINGIFDELRVQQFPGGIARAFFIATVSGTPSTSYKLTLKIEPSKGLVNQPNEFTLGAFTAPNGKNNLIVELINLGFKEKGDYRFILYEGKQEIGSTLLKVMRQQQEHNDIKLPN
ncbi:MAG: hypothetical protein A3B44_01785 [Candidatus Levybacteria bacterium RIFCSPLOWO2_01_FULL_38_21]|nr:MAG: hypothetical protein A3B44_01785 [Candidatus Levybacteria bacterium RIFCSPLOWO2_01_FULL_38_21]